MLSGTVTALDAQELDPDSVLSRAPVDVAGHRSQAEAAPRRALSTDEWREDLRHLSEHLRLLHADAFHSLSEHEFDARVRELGERIPTLSDDEVVVELARLVAAIGDGHTRISESAHIRERLYPLRLRLFPEGMFVVAAPDSLPELLGGRLLSIGGHAVDEVLAELESLTAADNRMNLRYRVASNLVVPAYLHGLGFAASAGRAKFRIENAPGQTREVVLRPAVAEEIDWRFVHDDLTDPPMYLRRVQETFHQEYLEKGSILYVQVNAVRNGDDRSMAEFYEEVLQRATASDVERLVLDLRLNGGGNNTLNWPLIYGLIQSGWSEREGRLFTLISRQTYSAAGHLATMLERHTGTVFIGEPTGAAPNHYGDARPFHLPNSGLRIGASTLFWQNSLPWDDRPWIPPDVATVLSWEDYRSGNDPALAAVRSYQKRPPLADRLRAVVEADGVAALRDTVRALTAEPSHRWADIEGALNQVGHARLWDEGPAAAIPVFELNAELYPASANVWDSLAEAHLEAGREAKAARYYRRALEINPKLPSAIMALDDLRRRGEAK